MGDRYLIIPCESEPALAVIWDRLEEQVLDVIDALQAAKYADEDALWGSDDPASISGGRG